MTIWTETDDCWSQFTVSLSQQTNQRLDRTRTSKPTTDPTVLGTDWPGLSCHNLDIVCPHLYFVSHNLDITPNNPEPTEAGLVPNLDLRSSSGRVLGTSCRFLTPPEQTSRRSLPDFRSRSSTGVTVLEILRVHRVRQGRSRNLEQQEQLLQDTWTGNPTSPVTWQPEHTSWNNWWCLEIFAHLLKLIIIP